MSEAEVERFLITVDPGNERVKRLLRSWWKPGPKNRQLDEGTILEKLGPAAYIFAATRQGLELFGWLQIHEGVKTVKIYRLKEVKARGEMGEMLVRAREAEKRHSSSSSR